MMKVGKSWGRGILFLISAVSNDSVRNINKPLRFMYLEYPLQDNIYLLVIGTCNVVEVKRNLRAKVCILTFTHA